MARKSRKETAQAFVPEVDTTCRAAIYVRLSVEDTHTRSASIETQQMIIAQFLERNPDIQVFDTYIDNGATGTNFHRPAFQQMLSDIEAGFVNCVIVKDLSRLGRNTIDTGYYIEQYFRIRKIRFIAINENFDTSASEDPHSGIIIPLRNMINEAYALDIGRKIKAQQRQAMKDGKFIGARTPYGYLKAPDDCHQLIVDPVAARKGGFYANHCIQKNWRDHKRRAKAYRRAKSKGVGNDSLDMDGSKQRKVPRILQRRRKRE